MSHLIIPSTLVALPLLVGTLALILLTPLPLSLLFPASEELHCVERRPLRRDIVVPVHEAVLGPARTRAEAPAASSHEEGAIGEVGEDDEGVDGLVP